LKNFRDPSFRLQRRRRRENREIRNIPESFIGSQNFTENTQK